MRIFMLTTIASSDFSYTGHELVVDNFQMTHCIVDIFSHFNTVSCEYILTPMSISVGKGPHQ